MKRLSALLVVTCVVFMMVGCAAPTTEQDKAMMKQAIAAGNSAKMDADRAEAAADRAEAAAQRAEDAAMKAERAFETSIKK